MKLCEVCAGFHLLCYLCICFLLKNTVWKCCALNSGMSVSLLHLNIWRFLLLFSYVCVCFPLIKKQLFVLVVLRYCRQMSNLLRLMKHSYDLCINFSYAAGRLLFAFRPLFSEDVQSSDDYKYSWSCAGFPHLHCGSCLLRSCFALNCSFLSVPKFGVFSTVGSCFFSWHKGASSKLLS